MTLADLLTACYQDLGYDPAPSTSVVARLTRYLAEGYYLILSMPEFASLRLTTLPFLSVSNQKVYGWPQAFVQIEQVVNVTQNVRLRLMTLDQMRTIDPQEVSGGTPTHYVPKGLGPVQQEPPLTHLWAMSTAPADTALVSVAGVEARGFQIPVKTTALTGTTPVDVGGPDVGGLPFPSYVSVHQFELAAVATGFVSLLGAMGKPVAPVVTNSGVGAYPAILRQYKITYTSVAGVVSGALTLPLRESIYSTPTSFTPSGAGASASVARPALLGEGETHWQVHGSADGVTYFQLSGDLLVATLSYSDTLLPANYATLPVSPVVKGTVLSFLPTGQKSAQYQQVRLWPTPSAADAYAVDGIVSLSGSPQTFDIPVIPADFQLVLTDYARMREYEYRDDTRFAMANAAYASKLKQMKTRLIDPPDYRPRVGRIPDRSSNLGSFYPPGRW